MSYRKILVGLTDIDSAASTLSVARAIAADHGARLLAVHVVPAVDGLYEGMTRDDLGKRLQEIFEQHRDDQVFSSEWRQLKDNALSISGGLVDLGNACDLIVVAGDDNSEERTTYWNGSQYVVGVSGRPVMLAPRQGETLRETKRVLIAWDGSALSSRVAFDALPLLQRADHVRVHRFNPPGEERRHVSGVAEMFAATLARHDVPTELTHSDIRHADIGEALLKIVEDDDFDVLIMGGRPHNRLRGMLFGDTTRHVLANARRAVLMGG